MTLEPGHDLLRGETGVRCQQTVVDRGRVEIAHEVVEQHEELSVCEALDVVVRDGKTSQRDGSSRTVHTAGRMAMHRSAPHVSSLCNQHHLIRMTLQQYCLVFTAHCTST